MSRHSFFCLLAVTLLFGSSGCMVAPAPAVSESQMEVVESFADNTATNAKELAKRKFRNDVDLSRFRRGIQPDYLIGRFDVLSINIFDEPGMEDLRVRVDADGLIQLPALKTHSVAGKTSLQVQQELTERYSTHFRNPWVMVSVTEFLSQPIYLLGEFNKPGVFYMDRPFSLVQALGLAAGMTDRAYLPGARLIRRNEILPVDVFALLREGDFDNNIWMKPGDTIYVPAIDDLDVLVLGAVQNPGAQPFTGTTSVLEAISQAGGHTAGLAELKNTRVIRTHSPIEGEMMVIDVIDIFKARAPDYRLSPGDIVYIPETVGGNWNELVEDIIPSLSQVNGLDRVVEFELIFNPSN